MINNHIYTWSLILHIVLVFRAQICVCFDSLKHNWFQPQQATVNQQKAKQIQSMLPAMQISASVA